MALSDDAEHTFLVEAYCLDFEKDNPQAADRFSLTNIDARSLDVVRRAKTRSKSVRVAQAALWLDRGVPERELIERFPISTSELAAALAGIGRSPAKSSEPARAPTPEAAAAPSDEELRPKTAEAAFSTLESQLRTGIFTVLTDPDQAGGVFRKVMSRWGFSETLPWNPRTKIGIWAARYDGGHVSLQISVLEATTGPTDSAVLTLTHMPEQSLPDAVFSHLLAKVERTTVSGGTMTLEMPADRLIDRCSTRNTLTIRLNRGLLIATTLHAQCEPLKPR
jgi:hypothetical protein